jgi:hypothetical protein
MSTLRVYNQPTSKYTFHLYKKIACRPTRGGLSNAGFRSILSLGMGNDCCLKRIVGDDNIKYKFNLWFNNTSMLRSQTISEVLRWRIGRICRSTGFPINRFHESPKFLMTFFSILYIILLGSIIIRGVVSFEHVGGEKERKINMPFLME